MSQAFIVLMAGVESGFLNKDFIEGWATKLISKVSCPPVWLMDLMEAGTESKILDVFRLKISEQGLMLDKGYAELLIGFYYLRFTNGDIPLNEYGSLVVDVVDAYDVNGIDPESLTGLFNKKPISVDKSRSGIDLYFSQYGKESKEFYLYLTSDDFIEKEPTLFAV